MSRGSSSSSNHTLPAFTVIIMMIFGFALSLPTPSSLEPAAATTAPEGNLTETLQETVIPSNEGENNSSSSKDAVMYSYAEANVSDDGTPSVRQLTIVKGKDGETRFAKNENGTVESGNWKGPIPSVVLPSTMNGVEEHLNTMTDPLLATLNQNIGNSLQDYIKKTFSFF